MGSKDLWHARRDHHSLDADGFVFNSTDGSALPRSVIVESPTRVAKVTGQTKHSSDPPTPATLVLFRTSEHRLSASRRKPQPITASARARSG